MPLDGVPVPEDVLEPERDAFPDRDGLGGLEVGVSEGGTRRLSPREVGEGAREVHEPFADDLERLLEDERIGIVRDEHARGAEVNDRLPLRARLAPRADVGDHVVARVLLDRGDAREVDLVPRALESVDLRLRHGRSELAFRVGERDPHVAPGARPRERREERDDPLAGVAGGERRLVVRGHVARR